MIISMMCAYLAATGRRDLFRWVFMGTGAALAGSSMAGVGLYLVAKDSFINSTAQTWFETAVFVVAVVALTYMTFWMRGHARSLRKDLGARMGAAVAGGSAFSLAVIALVTVGRESLETVIFLLATAFKSSALSLVVGALAGLALALALSIGIYGLGLRLNLRRFFVVLGAALMVAAAGLLADAVQNLQSLGVLPGSSQVLWNTGGILQDDSGLGDVLHGLIGYASSPSLLQVIAWALFLVVGLVFFLGGTARATVRG